MNEVIAPACAVVLLWLAPWPLTWRRWRLAHALALSALALLQACAHGPTHPALQSADGTAATALPPLVPVRHYVAPLGGAGGHVISPDGQRLAWIARAGLGPAVYVRDLASGQEQVVFRGGAGLLWADDSRALLLVVQSGDENAHVLRVDVTQPGAQVVDLTPFVGRSAYVQGLVEGSADVLIASNRREPRVFDLYRWRSDTGALELLAQNPGNVFFWATDAAGRVFGRARREGNDFHFDQPDAAAPGGWVRLFGWHMLDTVQPLVQDAPSGTVWALSNRGRDKMALVRLRLADGHEEVVHDDPQADVVGAFVGPRSLRPLLAWAEPGLPRQRVFDERLAAALRTLRQGTAAGDGTPRLFVPASLTRDEQRIIGTDLDGRGGRIALLDLRSGGATVLAELTRTQAGRGTVMPVAQPVAFDARDGLRLNALLTLPAGVAPRRLPAVLLVHGGPWARDSWAGSREVDFLVNRGYAVLQVNYRGSTGYGRAFRDKAVGQFAGRMHDDVLDGLDWLVAQGIADPARVAIVGNSYGGYEALVAATFSPGRFACAVAGSPPTDLVRLLETTPPSWEAGLPFWHHFVGDPARAEDRARMQAQSPLYRAASAAGPILIVHGALDPRVRVEQSQRMVQALRDAGKPVDYLLFANEGHGVARWNNALTAFRRMEDFLAGCLGGRSGGLDLFELASWAF